MPEVYYEALESTGALTRGTFDADSDADAAARLAACELVLQRTTSPPPAMAQAGAAGESPQSEIRETLLLLAQATPNAKLRKEIREFLRLDEGGAARPTGNAFLNALLAQCRLAGDPLTALGPLIEFERDLSRVKNDSMGRFVYAYGLLVFASCLFSLTDYFMGESFRVMFRDFQIQLPTITLIMMNVGPLFWSMTISLISAPILILMARALFGGQIWFDRGLDRVVLWGPWRRWRYSAQSLAYLGSALKPGGALPQACEAAADMLPRPYAAWQLREIGHRIESGATLQAACTAAKIHAMVTPFLLASERQGHLPEGCMTGARLLLERCRRRRMFFAYFLESFAMVFVLVTALALFASYMWPIFALFDALTR